MFKTILCALDGSSHAERALEIAIDLAQKYRAPLLVAHALLRSNAPAELERFAEVEGLTARVRPELSRLQQLQGRLEVGEPSDDRAVSSRVLVELGQHVLDEAADRAREAGLADVSTLLLDGDPADQILRTDAERGVDCVVLGSRGLSDITGLFLGSVSHKVAHRARCTCITVK